MFGRTQGRSGRVGVLVGDGGTVTPVYPLKRYPWSVGSPRPVGAMGPFRIKVEDPCFRVRSTTSTLKKTHLPESLRLIEQV